MEVHYLLMKIRLLGEELLRGKCTGRYCLIICKL